MITRLSFVISSTKIKETFKCIHLFDNFTIQANLNALGFGSLTYIFCLVGSINKVTRTTPKSIKVLKYILNKFNAIFNEWLSVYCQVICGFLLFDVASGFVNLPYITVICCWKGHHIHFTKYPRFSIFWKTIKWKLID